MQALLLTKYRQLELTSLERPTLGPRDVLIAIQACGICGSDVHGFDGSTGRRIPPLVMGHETAGTVVEIGAEVVRCAVGDRVAVDSLVWCGECDACRQGKTNMCTKRGILGVACQEFRRQGAFAEFLSVPEHIVHHLPPELPFEHAALVEPVSVALHAVGRLAIEPGDRAVVVGSGMIGLLVIQALRVAGCGEVIAIDVEESRLRLAEELGATATIAAADDPMARVLQLTDGRGADVAVEVVGNEPAFRTAVGSVRRGGQVCLVGNLQAEVPLPLQEVVMREIVLTGSCATSGEYPRAIELLATGQIRVQPLISAVAPLHDGPQWFERLYAREPGLMKVILCPNGQEAPHAQSI
jgi:L-iditol 2-dehydrogenase